MAADGASKLAPRTEPGLQAVSHCFPRCVAHNHATSMQDRLNQNDVTNRVNVEDPRQVRDAVVALLGARFPGVSFSPLAKAFDDFDALFAGRFSGYLPCDTLYHDVRHTLDMTLAAARLIDGHERVCAPADRLGPRRAMLGVLVALLHDTGYLKKDCEAHVANGAVFTRVHVSRSSDFALGYLPQLGFGAEAALAARLVHFTGYEIDLDDIEIDDPRDRALGCMVGAADLIGQMSDRLYLEKCRDFLYPEFVWADIARTRYASASDLIMKTPEFYENVARARIAGKLAGADRFAEAHFDGPSLYQAAIDRNIRFLKHIVATAELARLRRACYSLSASAVSRPATALSA